MTETVDVTKITDAVKRASEGINGAAFILKKIRLENNRMDTILKVDFCIWNLFLPEAVETLQELFDYNDLTEGFHFNPRGGHIFIFKCNDNYFVITFAGNCTRATEQSVSLAAVDAVKEILKKAM